MNIDKLQTIGKSEIPSLAMNLTEAEVTFLVKMLSEKDDTLRYHAFLLLQENSRKSALVYEHWNELEEKLESTNSYQRSLGLMLISENVRWDKEGKFGKTLNKYLICCEDEKFITSRQAIQGFANVLKATSKYDEQIEQGLNQLHTEQYKENQQRLLKKDSANILNMIKNRR